MVGVVAIREFRADTLNGRVFGDNRSATIDIGILPITAEDVLASVVPGNTVIHIQIGGICAQTESSTWSCGLVIYEGAINYCCRHSTPDLYGTAITCRHIVDEKTVLNAQLAYMTMNGCSVLVVLGAIVTEDAVPDDSSIIENCSAAIAIAIRSSLIDAVLNDKSVKDGAN